MAAKTAGTATCGTRRTFGVITDIATQRAKRGRKNLDVGGHGAFIAVVDYFATAGDARTEGSDGSASVPL